MLGFNLRQVIREKAMAELNLNLEEADNFAISVCTHLAGGDWIEFEVNGVGTWIWNLTVKKGVLCT